jgi:hypothetical protein
MGLSMCSGHRRHPGRAYATEITCRKPSARAVAGHDHLGHEPSLAEAPPFRLPGQHFAASLVFLVAGAAGLVWRAESLAAGAFSDPRLLATTHLFTLGWIGTSIMGALYQFLPVALGSGIRWERLTHLTFGLWTAGVAVFVVGLATTTGVSLLAGAGLLGAAILLFATNLAVTLPGTERRGLTWWCVAGSTLALLAAWLLGALLAVNLTGGLLGSSRFSVLAIHVHVAAGGWVLLTMVGVAHHLMPMFLLSHGAGTRLGKAAAVLLGAGTTGLVLTGHGLPTAALPYVLGLLAAGTGAFLLQALFHFLRRRRPRVDPGMRLVGGALVLLALALVAGVTILLSSTGDPSLLTAYGVLLVPGGLGLFVAGHYYKIVPFLTWFHRFGPVASEREVPGVAELFDHRAARAAGTLLIGGVVTMSVGILLGGVTLCLAGAIAFGAGALLESLQMLLIARQRP